MNDNIQETGNQFPQTVETVPKGVWPFWPTFGFGVATFAVYAITQILVALFFVIVEVVSKEEALLDEAVNKLATDGLLLSIATITSAIIGLGFIILAVILRKGPPLAEYLGLRRISRKSFIALIVLSCVIIAFFLIIYRLQESGNSNFTIETYETSVWPVLYGIAAILFAPAFEEAFFRGFLFVGFRQSHLGSVGTILVTALAWAILHLQYNLYSVALIFGLGILLGIVRLKTGSLWSTLFLHGLWNLMAVLASAYYVNNVG